MDENDERSKRTYKEEEEDNEYIQPEYSTLNPV